MMFNRNTGEPNPRFISTGRPRPLVRCLAFLSLSGGLGASPAYAQVCEDQDAAKELIKEAKVLTDEAEEAFKGIREAKTRGETRTSREAAVSKRDEAVRKLDEANALCPNPALLVYRGRANKAVGSCSAARRDFEAAANSDNPKVAAFVKGELESLEAACRVGAVRVFCVDEDVTLTLNGQEYECSQVIEGVEAGEATLTVSREGRRSVSITVRVRGMQVNHVDAPALEEADVEVENPPDTDATASKADDDKPAAKTGDLSRDAIAFSVAGGLVATGGVVAIARGQGLIADADARFPVGEITADEAIAQKRSGVLWRGVGIGAVGIGAAALVYGLLGTPGYRAALGGPAHAQRIRWSLTPVKGGAATSLTLSF